jgi:hypothetical protein
MSIQKRDNLFTGVNPLLMSRLQTKSEFGSFHNQYLGELTGHLNEVLPENYKAREEDRLTLSYAGYLGQHYMKPDILISRSQSYTTLEPTALETTPTLLLPIDDEYPENTERIVVIHSTDESQLPVLVIEMLSPSNKLGSKDTYIEKRKELIQAKLILVEIDLLHATPSPIYRVPIYPHDEGATPYYIAMTNPNTGKLGTALYQFGINQPMPKIRLPLLHGDSVLCDFDTAYQSTFRRGRYGQDVDYTDAPIDLGAYSTSDQTKILSHLATIQNNP